MELQPGIRLVLAPRFPNGLAWSDRVRINGGIEVVDGRFCPRPDWRPLQGVELDRLIGDGPTDAPAGTVTRSAPAGIEAVLPSSRLGLLNLPSHLRGEWWVLADRQETLAGDGRPYRAFAQGVIEFLRFKQLPLPGRCRVEVAVRRPGERPTGWCAPAGSAGAPDSGETGPTPAGETERIIAVINLGDEPTHVVLLNLAPAAIASAIGLPWPIDSAREVGAGLLGRFFTARPGYPLVRMRLEAGDGLWFPAHGLVHDVCTLGKREVDVALTIREDAGPEALPF